MPKVPGIGMTPGCGLGKTVLARDPGKIDKYGSGMVTGQRGSYTFIPRICVIFDTIAGHEECL